MAVTVFVTNSFSAYSPLVSNPNSYTYHSQLYPNSKLIFSSQFISNKKTHPHLRLRLQNSVVNASDEDSHQSLPPEDEVDGIGVKAALSILKFYKREISPLLPRSCRYVPTCSEYSMIAYKKYGFAKGSVLTAWRICRCNPLGGTGFDPPRWFGESDTQDQ